MSSTIIFPTLENKDIEVTMEDAKFIALESATVAAILSGELQGDYFSRKYGGKAINFAMEYCKKFGEIESNCSERSDLLETKDIDVQPWVDGFISRIEKVGLGLVHELLAVSQALVAFRLTDLACQCLFDHLIFKDYGEFREAFAFEFLFPPNFKVIEVENVEEKLLSLELPTLEEIDKAFKLKIPFTDKQLKTAESENKLVRVGGNLEYKTNKRWVEELLIKIEYIVRRLISFQEMSRWTSKTSSRCIRKSLACMEMFLNDQSNSDVGELWPKLRESASTFHEHIFYGLKSSKEISNPCTSYEDIKVISDAMDKIEMNLAGKANEKKKEAEGLTQVWHANWQTDHPDREDKIIPHLTYYLESRYQEIHCILCSLRCWVSPVEVQSKLGKPNTCEEPKFEHMGDQTEDVESEELVSQKSRADEKICGDVVSTLEKLRYLAVGAARGFIRKYCYFRELQIEMRQSLHLELLLKDEEVLTFICKEKFKLYMRASKQGTDNVISFVGNKEEFDRIMEEADQKFGRSSLDVEEAKREDVEEARRKYFLYYKKFHSAMVDETKHQTKLRLGVGKGSMGVEKGREKRQRTTRSCGVTKIHDVHG